MSKATKGQGDPQVAEVLKQARGSTLGKVLKLALLLATVAGCVGGYLYWRRTQTAAEQVKYVEVAASRADLKVTVAATGTIQGLSSVDVGAEISGKVTRVLVDFNDKVEVGQLLAEIDPEQYQASYEESEARVRASEASVRNARATVEETRLTFERAKEEYAKGLASKRDLEAAKAASERANASLSSASADLTVSRASLKNVKTKLDRTKILSPVKGIVLSRAVEPGQTVTAGFQTPVLFKVTEDLARMRLTVLVNESDVGRVREGLEASFTVDAFPGKVFPSKVLSLRYEPKTDQNVVSYEAILSVDNADLSLRPGMTATATIVASQKKGALVVPNTALRFAPQRARPASSTGIAGAMMPQARTQPQRPRARSDGPRVHVVGEDGKAKAVPVKTGASDGERTEILEGLEEGQKVIVDTEEKGAAPRRTGANGGRG